MGRRIEFSLPLLPVPKQSTRFGNGRAYQKDRIKENARALGLLMRQWRPSKPLCGPVRLILTLRYPWRHSEPQKRRKRSRWKFTAPDSDNLQKQVKDVLQAVGFVRNDGQICWTECRKLWTDQEGTDVVLEEIDE